MFRRPFLFCVLIHLHSRPEAGHLSQGRSGVSAKALQANASNIYILLPERSPVRNPNAWEGFRRRKKRIKSLSVGYLVIAGPRPGVFKTWYVISQLRLRSPNTFSSGTMLSSSVNVSPGNAMPCTSPSRSHSHITTWLLALG